MRVAVKGDSRLLQTGTAKEGILQSVVVRMVECLHTVSVAVNFFPEIAAVKGIHVVVVKSKRKLHI